MKINYRSIIKGALTGCMMAFMASCADEVDLPEVVREGYSPDTQLVISLAIPDQGEGEGTSPASRAQIDPQGAEGKINDLRMIAFGYDGGTSVMNRALPFSASDNMPVDPHGYATFEIKGFTPGKYAVYIVANMGQELADVTTEQQLKNKIKDYTNSLPVPGNLVMVYEPGARVEINQAGYEPAIVEASMKIAAVKVRYNIIFDKKNCGDIFGDAGLRITSVSVDGVAKRSYVVANTADTDPGLRSITPAGVYYAAYTENQNNASVNNADVIGVSGSGTPTAAYASTWVYRGDIYLPERYVPSDGTPTTMNIEAVVTGADGVDGNVHCKYSINLAAYDGAPAEKSMPRGNYYEVIGKVKTLGNARLDASIHCKDWGAAVMVDADMVHTYLNVDKTSLKVASLAPDSLCYLTDGRGGAQFGCETKLLEKPVVTGTFVERSGKKYLRLEVNPEIDVTKLTDAQAVGTAVCSLKAGNICKKFNVTYDIKPFFYVTPVANKIQWSDSQPENRKKRFHYVTNLGGLMITDKNDHSTVRIGKSGNNILTSYTYIIEIAVEGETTRRSHVKLTCDNPTAAEGDLYAEALYNPGTTQIHEFDFCPIAMASNVNKYGVFAKNGKVTVMKPYGDYRIYFRAINDWHKFDGGAGNVSSEWLEGANPMGSSYPTEYYGTAKQNNNWIDYWYCASQNDTHAWGNAASNNRYPYEDSHNIYIWTQLGETYSWQDSPKVWRFTGEYKYRNPMKGDYANPGWYYYDLPVTQNPKGWSGGASGNVNPEPGTTLMIFNNHTNAGDQGFTVHRVAHHLMPGISLFDYEDHEGWVLYDPTTESLYRTYDERPYIEDVTYTIYSDAKPTGWWRKYGVAQENPPTSGTPAQYTIYSNNVDSRTTETIGGKTYYKYQIRMKAVNGQYAKAININFEGSAGGSTTQTAPQRVYYYSKSGWSTPRVYIYNGGNKHTEWGSTPAMTKGHSENGYDYYYYDIPSGFENGQVIFQDNNRNNQVPAANQAGFSLGGKTKCYYPATGAWSDFTAPPITVTTPSGKVSSKLFGGRQFANNTGYYNSATGTWTAGKPQ